MKVGRERVREKKQYAIALDAIAACSLSFGAPLRLPLFSLSLSLSFSHAFSPLLPLPHSLTLINENTTKTSFKKSNFRNEEDRHQPPGQTLCDL